MGIAEERIRILFSEAERRPEYEARYLELAEKIGERNQTPIPKGLKYRYCPRCMQLLKPGLNCTVRVNSEKEAVEYRCDDCGYVRRHGY